MPVGTLSRSPGASVTSTRLSRSAPASPGWAYVGSGRSGSRRWTSSGTACSGPLDGLEVTTGDPTRRSRPGRPGCSARIPGMATGTPSGAPAGGPEDSTGPVTYRERLTPSGFGWFAAAAIGASLGLVVLPLAGTAGFLVGAAIGSG